MRYNTITYNKRASKEDSKENISEVCMICFFKFPFFEVITAVNIKIISKHKVY
jgi:hypothetical protein